MRRASPLFTRRVERNYRGHAAVTPGEPHHNASHEGDEQVDPQEENNDRDIFRAAAPKGR